MFLTKLSIILFLPLLQIVLSAVNIYIDSGLDKTFLRKNISETQKIDFEFEILTVLGLPDKPKKVNTSLKKSTLKYLMSMYNSLTNKGQEIHRTKRSADFFVNVEKRNAIVDSDIIMTFDAMREYGPVRHDRGEYLWFNLSDMPAAEDILGAELRIFQKGVNIKRKFKYVYTVRIDQVIDPTKNMLQYISSLNTSESYTGWLDLNLTSCFSSWASFPESHNGLYLSVSRLDKPDSEMPGSVIGLIISRRNEETDPFMTAFLKSSNQVYTKRIRRSVKTKQSKRSEVFKYPVLMKSYRHNTWNTGCRIHSLHIDFKDLKWQDWIIAPEAYSAYYCAGECKFPLTSNMNATNHAVVQSWVHLLNPDKFPKPSCAPIETAPIYLIYQHGDNAAMKKRKDMIVNSCGCH